MDLLIKNVRMITQDNQLNAVEIWIKEERIHAIGKNFDEGSFEQIIDAKNQLVTQGLVDVHVHLREPGVTYK